MFYLEDGLNKEAFRVAVVAGKGESLAHDPAAWYTLDMDDKVDSFGDLCFGVGEGRLGMASHDEIGEAMQGFLGRVGVDRSQRTRMAGVEGIEQRACFDSAHFPRMIRSGRQRRADFRRSSKVMLALNVSVWHSAGRMFGFWI